MISIESLVHLVIYLLVIGLVVGLLIWLVDVVASHFPVTAPFTNVARVLIIAIGVLILISLLLGLVGHPIITR